MNNPRNKYVPAQPAARGGMLPLRAMSPSSKDITDMYANAIYASDGSLIPSLIPLSSPIINKGHEDSLEKQKPKPVLQDPILTYPPRHEDPRPRFSTPSMAIQLELIPRARQTKYVSPVHPHGIIDRKEKRKGKRKKKKRRRRRGGVPPSYSQSLRPWAKELRDPTRSRSPVRDISRGTEL